MRVSDDYVRERYEAYAAHVDELVSPERLGAAAAKTALLGGDMEAIAELSTDLTLAVVTVTPAPIVGERVNAVGRGADARVYAHGRGRDPMTIPLPGSTVAAGDRLALLVENESVEAVRERLLGNGTSP